MTDWIEWSGGECPVEGATVDVKLRSGDVWKNCCAWVYDWPRDDLRDTTHAGPAWWRHEDHENDIVAYRLVDAPGASTEPESALTRQPGGTHYRDSAIQPVQFIEANKLGFLEGCIIKRAARHDKPTGKGREDIEKIIHEAQLLLELRYGAVARWAAT